LRVEVQLPDGPQTRSYSLIGTSKTGVGYRIAVRRQRQGRGGSNYMRALEQGAPVKISHPQNFFDLALDAPEYLFIAGGIGITPIISMVETVAGRGTPYRLLYLASTWEGMPFLTELREVCEGNLTTYCLEVGQKADLDQEIAHLGPGTQAYVCGPVALMDGVREIWSAQNRPAVDLRFETFGSGGSRLAQPFKVHLADRQTTLSVGASQTILEAIRTAGIPALSDCLRGECGVCTLRVLSVEGKLDHGDIFLSPQQKSNLEAMCICISRAISEVPGTEALVTLDTGYRPQG